jgi:hypothetical protein
MNEISANLLEVEVSRTRRGGKDAVWSCEVDEKR